MDALLHYAVGQCCHSSTWFGRANRNVRVRANGSQSDLLGDPWLLKHEFDNETFVWYNLPKLAILDIAKEDMMITKRIGSTQAQNNFGQVLDDVTRNLTRYIIERRGVPQVIILSFDDFAHVLDDESERQQMDTIIRELRPGYHLGQIIAPTSETE